jgi:flavin-dependent dehydrogenase
LTDVCVMGAGPAGAVFAARMAQMGHGVVLIDCPRRRTGPVAESVGMDVLPLLGVAGMDDCLSSSAVAAPALSISWGSTATLREDFPKLTLMVDRVAFDAALLRNAERCGVRVLRSEEPPLASRTEDQWRIGCRSDGCVAIVESDLVIFATGRRRAPNATEAIGTKLLAISGRWCGRSVPASARIEACADGWFWGAPVPDGTYASIAFVDPQDFGRTRGTLKSRFEELLRASKWPGQGVAPLAGPVHGFDATAYIARQPATATSLLIGDAALALDPLSSSGIRNAVQTSLAASVTANTILRRPDDGSLARDFYRDQLRRSAVNHARWAASHYAEAARHFGTPFWLRRTLTEKQTSGSGNSPREISSIAERPVELSRAAEFVTHPCVQGDFVVALEAVKVPGFDCPVAYVGGQHITPLLRSIRRGSTPLQLARSWSERMPLCTAVATALWLVRHAVLVPQEHVCQIASKCDPVSRPIVALTHFR